MLGAPQNQYKTVLTDKNAFQIIGERQCISLIQNQKPPSKYTKELQDNQRNTLPFNDKRDYDEVIKGFVAAPESKQILAEDGHVVWDIDSYGFLLDETQFDSIHPSLQRQATLNMGYGLYEVVPDQIWQVRGFDLANISFIKGRTGWIIIDALTCEENRQGFSGFYKCNPWPIWPALPLS